MLSLLPLTALLLAGVTETSAGQPYEHPAGSVLVIVGADHHRFIDEAFTTSRLKFAGTSYGAAFAYRRESGSYLLDARVEGGAGEAAVEGGRLASGLYHIGLGASFGRRVAEYAVGGARSVGYLGAHLSSANSVAENEPVLENVSVTFRHTLGLSLHQTTRLGRAAGLQVDLALPLAGWIKRAAYDGGANQKLERDRHHVGRLLFGDSRFSIANPLTAPRIGVTYTHRLHRNADLALTYRAGYLRVGEDARLRAYHNGLLVGLRYSF